MLKRCYFCVSIFMLLLFLQNIVFGQDKNILKLKSGNEIEAVGNYYQEVSKISISTVEFEGLLYSFGKARKLGTSILNKLKSKNSKIYQQVRKNNTAIDILQGENKFYLIVVDSISLEQFREAKVKVKCRAWLLRVTANDTIFYIPIITSIRKI